MPNHLVGMDSGLDNRTDVRDVFFEAMPELANMNKLGDLGKSWDNANVLSLQPDAVILPYNSYKAAVNNNLIETFNKAGIPVIFINYHTEKVEDMVKSITMLGKLFGKEDVAKEMADLYFNKTTYVYDKIQEILKTRSGPTTYVEVGSDVSTPQNSYGKTIMWGALLYACGADNIYNGTSAYGPLDSSYVLIKDPQKIVLTGSYWAQNDNYIPMGFNTTSDKTNAAIEKMFMARSGWSDLSAYKNKEIYVINHGMCRDILDYSTVEYLAKIIFPEEFADLDPLCDLQYFYSHYLGFELTGNWFYKYN